MAGQMGMYWDECGKFLKSMVKEHSAMEGYQELLLEIDDCEANGSSTVGRGDETIEKPYLVILGALVPSNMKAVAGPGSDLWLDGQLARCSFTCAPNTGGKDQCID